MSVESTYVFHAFITQRASEMMFGHCIKLIMLVDWLNRALFHEERINKSSLRNGDLSFRVAVSLA
jgi:hypothetical protein